MATANRAMPLGMACCRDMAATMPEKAPTLIKPAWPKDSSPEKPTTRFKDTAMVT